FFQAEDGIRDATVTGVQTCALPISMLVMPAMADHVSSVVHQRSSLQQHAGLCRKMVQRLKLVEQQNAQLAHVLSMCLVLLQAARSEERRVGKEWSVGSGTGSDYGDV